MHLKKQFTHTCSHSSVHTMFTYASGSVVHVDIDKLALCMHMKSTVHLKKQFTHTCSHSSVHTLFTYASGSVVHVDVDKLALCMHMKGTVHLKKQFTHTCSHIVHICKWQCSTCRCR